MAALLLHYLKTQLALSPDSSRRSEASYNSSCSRAGLSYEAANLEPTIPCFRQSLLALRSLMLMTSSSNLEVKQSYAINE